MARPKSQKKPTSKSSPTESLALSSLHARRLALEKEHTWLLKQIKRKRTELKNFLSQMRALATEIFHRGEPLYQKLTDIESEIHALFEEILTKRQFGQQTRKNIREIYQTLQLMGIISPKGEESELELDELFEADREEEQEFDQAPPEDFFSGGRHRRPQFAEPMPETEDFTRPPSSRQIRRTFLRLAAIFHPDKVTDSESQMSHTEIMKEVNRAYKEGDLARLLEIERQHQAGESLSVELSSENDQKRQCERLEIDNQLLTDQYERLKQELRLVRNTPEGEMVQDYRACMRNGLDPIEEMLADASAQIQGVEKIRNFVRDFRDKKMTVKEFLRGPAGLTPKSAEEMEEILDNLLSQLYSAIR